MAGYASEGSHGFISRRGFIKVMSVSAAALLTPGCLREWLSLGHRPKPHAHTPFITPNNDFYLVAVDPSFRPPLEPANVNSKWFLEVFEDNGSSNKLSYNDLFNQATQKIHYTFECIGNTVGGQLIGNAQWHVVPLKKILGPMMKQSKNVKSVMFEGLDDFFSSVSIERAMDDYSFIAMQMNGESLPAAHGFPARVILPDLYGMKQPRWLKRITLFEKSDTTSYWEQRGWAGEVPVKTMSRLDPRGELPAKKAVEFTGVAFAGQRGIKKVEVSLNKGESWLTCEMVTPMRNGVWSLWRYIWQEPVPGNHNLTVRATDGNGVLQTAVQQRPYPDGASGYDHLSFSIKA